MKFLVAYDVATSYSDSKLEYRIVDDDSAVARIFATSERAWFGEVLDGEPPPPACEPGYALVIDHGDRGRPQERPRAEQITIREYFEAATVVGEARERAGAVAMRVLRRKPEGEPAWPADARVLRAETLAHPDDDDPRLVFADAIAGKRGSLVIVQCELARGGLTPAESRARRRAQRELLAKSGAAWSRLAGLAKRCVFRRGFVDAAEIALDILLNDDQRMFDAAPHLTSIAITLASSMYVRQLARASWWPRLRGVSIDGRMLASGLVGMLETLRALELWGAEPAHVRAIAAADLGALEVLRLPAHELDAGAIQALVSRSPSLRVLDVSSAQSSARIAIPDSVRELHATAHTTTIPRGIEKLALYGSIDLHVLDGLRSLRSLDLHGAVELAELAELSLPALRELRLDSDALAIARRYGPQLELLDLRGVAGVESNHDELRELVAGEVWLGKPDPRRPLMAASYLPDEPMWDTGSVELSE